MRILYHHRTLADGAEGVHIREMVDAFRGLGHEVQVAALAGDGSEASPNGPRCKWDVVSRMIPSWAYEGAELAYNFVAAARLRRAIRQFRPDFIYDRYNSYSNAAVSVGRRAGLPVLLEVNAPVAYERATYQEKPIKFPKLAARYERQICLRASHIIVVSTPLKEFLVEQRGIPASQVTVLPNGANPGRFDPRIDGTSVRNHRGLNGRTVIGFVGILRKWHGTELLFHAFSLAYRRCQDLHLLIVGDGPLEESLKGEAATLGIDDRVTFCGRLRHDEVPAHVAAMDIAVSPRATFYASPMKILEYMAMGVATIAPRMPNIEDIVRDGADGLLFDPESAESFARSLTALAEDIGLRERIGRNARLKIETSLNWLNNANAVIQMAESPRGK